MTTLNICSIRLMCPEIIHLFIGLPGERGKTLSSFLNASVKMPFPLAFQAIQLPIKLCILLFLQLLEFKLLEELFLRNCKRLLKTQKLCL